VIAREAPVIPVWQARSAVVAGKDVANLRTAVDPLSFLHLSGLRR
jgi:peptide/nickel transport system substrate-binding protein